MQLEPQSSAAGGDVLESLGGAPPFAATLDLNEREAVVRIAGEIDLSTCEQVTTLVRQAVTERSRIVFDLTETTFMDSSGLAVILRANRALGQIPEAVVVRSASPSTRSLFRLTGCEPLVTFDG